MTVEKVSSMKTTSSVAEVLNNTIVTTGETKYKTTVTTVGSKYEESENLYNHLTDLLNPDVTWKPWYCKRFHAIGRERVLVLASQAKADGLTPKKLFSHLLKLG